MIEVPTVEECRDLIRRWRASGVDVAALWETVNSITPAPVELADTSTMARTVRALEGKQMFTNTTESNLTVIIAAATLAAFIASLVL